MASIVYYSLTGQTRRFINKVQGFDTYEISSAVAPVTMTEPFIMVIPSYESHVYGDVIETAEEFLEWADNAKLCKGFFGGGNRNFAQLFCVTVKELSAEFDIPYILLLFIFKQFVKHFPTCIYLHDSAFGTIFTVFVVTLLFAVVLLLVSSILASNFALHIPVNLSPPNVNAWCTIFGVASPTFASSVL